MNDDKQYVLLILLIALINGIFCYCICKIYSNRIPLKIHLKEIWVEENMLNQLPESYHISFHIRRAKEIIYWLVK